MQIRRPSPNRPPRERTAAPDGVRFGGFTTGPLQRALARTIEAATKSTASSKFQIAVLRVPALYLLALGLHDEGGNRLVPVPPSPAPLKAGESYPAERALASLAEAAKAVLQGDEARN